MCTVYVLIVPVLGSQRHTDFWDLLASQSNFLVIFKPMRDPVPKKKVEEKEKD